MGRGEEGEGGGRGGREDGEGGGRKKLCQGDRLDRTENGLTRVIHHRLW